MFRRIEIAADVVGNSVVFRFPKPVSILVVAISDHTGEFIWQLEAEEFQPLPEGSVVSEGKLWRVDDAPAEVIEAARMVEQRAELELRQFGPKKPLIAELVYGNTPSGYRSDTPAPKLAPGQYAVIVFAEQGNGNTTFTIAAG